MLSCFNMIPMDNIRINCYLFPRNSLIQFLFLVMQMNLKATRNVWGQDLCHKTSATPLPLIPSMDTVV